MAIFGFLSRLFGGSDPSLTLYQHLVEQARAPLFYQLGYVEDRFEARFEFLLLHLAVVHGALEQPATLHPARQRLMEHFVADLDHQMREIGVSDSGISRKMTKTAEHIYGRILAYGAALQAPSVKDRQSALKGAIALNLGLEPGDEQALDALADYAAGAADVLGQADKKPDLQWCRWPTRKEH